MTLIGLRLIDGCSTLPDLPAREDQNRGMDLQCPGQHLRALDIDARAWMICGLSIRRAVLRRGIL